MSRTIAKRKRRNTRAVDVTAMRHAFDPRRTYLAQGKVLAVEDDDDDGTTQIKVELWPDQTIVFAQLAVDYGGEDYGDWGEPDVGDKVLCVNCSKKAGDYGEVFVIARLHSASKKKPTGAAAGKRRMVIKDGDDLDIDISGGGKLQVNVTGTGGGTIDVSSAGTLSLIGKEVIAKNSGSAVSLAKKSEHNNHMTIVYNVHVHNVPMVGSTGPPTVTETADPGTTVLKGE